MWLLILGLVVLMSGVAMWIYSWYLHVRGERDQDRWLQERAERERRIRELTDNMKRTETDTNERLRAARSAAERDMAEMNRLAQSLRNLVEGYGQRYLIPVSSLVDELAEAVDHREAGQRLKAARAKTRKMVRDGVAATCEGPEDDESQQVIALVLAAFQGAADAVIDDVHNANYGQAAQQVRDVFNIVNSNAQAWRNAKIEKEFLVSRLEELKWAAIAKDLLRQEREEQKRLRESAREEERVRREVAKAAEEAAREQALIEQALQRARSEAEHASADQRGQFEQQMQELQQRLKEAEERNQRVKSMAEQTRRGHVYVISNVGSFGEGVYKIGLTRRIDPMDRIWELSDASVPFDFDVHAIIPAEDAPALEHELHNRFVMTRVNKVNHRKEFFRADLAEVREALSQLGHHAQWTMAAAATEHRETQAIEQMLATDSAAKERWIRRQNLLEAMEESEETSR